MHHLSRHTKNFCRTIITLHRSMFSTNNKYLKKVKKIIMNKCDLFGASNRSWRNESDRRRSSSRIVSDAYYYFPRTSTPEPQDNLDSEDESMDDMYTQYTYWKKDLDFEGVAREIDDGIIAGHFAQPVEVPPPPRSRRSRVKGLDKYFQYLMLNVTDDVDSPPRQGHRSPNWFPNTFSCIPFDNFRRIPQNAPYVDQIERDLIRRVPSIAIGTYHMDKTRGCT